LARSLHPVSDREDGAFARRRLLTKESILSKLIFSPAFIFISLMLVFLLLVLALCRNEPPPTSDDAQVSWQLVA
jgi:hypothetical protein